MSSISLVPENIHFLPLVSVHLPTLKLPAWTAFCGQSRQPPLSKIRTPSFSLHSKACDSNLQTSHYPKFLALCILSGRLLPLGSSHRFFLTHNPLPRRISHTMVVSNFSGWHCWNPFLIFWYCIVRVLIPFCRLSLAIKDRVSRLC